MKRLVVALLALVMCERTLSESTTMFTRTSFPGGWREIGSSPGETSLEFTVALKLRNMAEFEDLYWRLSDPTSEVYGRWLTKEEIWARTAPSSQDFAIVNEWFLSFAGVRTENFVDAIRVVAPASAIASMFPEGRVREFHSVGSGTVIHKLMGSLTLPSEVMARVDMITGISDWPIPHKARPLSPHTAAEQAAPAQQTSKGHVIPETVRRMYNISDELRATNNKSTQVVVEFLSESSFYYHDLEMAANVTCSPFTNITEIVGKFGGNFVESVIDVQAITEIGIGGVSKFWTVDKWMYEYAVEAMHYGPEFALVHSISWGWMETLSCQVDLNNTNCSYLGIDSQQYVNRTDQEFMKAGAMGISFLVCAQDEGAPSWQNNYCMLDSTQPIWPVYPATSPYVLAVGSTTIVDYGNEPTPHCPACEKFPCANGTLEVSVTYENTNMWTTGGGFSDYIARPFFQQNAVAAYLNNSAANLPPQQFFNARGRAYPDVATLGHKYIIVSGGVVEWGYGTSVSTPILAGMITLLNDMRLNANKSPLGPLAPLLYRMWETDVSAFNDITDGSNNCTGEMCCEYGYTATEGFDTVSGLGTPNFGRWMEYVSYLP